MVGLPSSEKTPCIQKIIKESKELKYIYYFWFFEYLTRFGEKLLFSEKTNSLTTKNNQRFKTNFLFLISLLAKIQWGTPKQRGMGGLF